SGPSTSVHMNSRLGHRGTEPNVGLRSDRMADRRQVDTRRRRRSLHVTWMSILLAATTRSWAVEAPRLRPWNEYRVIMWVGDRAYQRPEKVPLFFQRLREMGINTAMVYSDADPQPLVDNKMPYYVENIVNKGLHLKRNSPVAEWNKLVEEWTKTRDKAL